MRQELLLVIPKETLTGKIEPKVNAPAADKCPYTLVSLS